MVESASPYSKGPGLGGDFIREALDKFIVSHAAEFMPVAFPE